jgi:hypothetical protein
MLYYLIKIFVSAVLIVVVSEIAKRNSFAAAVTASLPLLSIMAFVWLYIDTGDVQKISTLSVQVFWLVIPSLVFFVALPALLHLKINFYVCIFVSMMLTAVAYYLLILLLKAKGIQI